jgi:hypothetical protein
MIPVQDAQQVVPEVPLQAGLDAVAGVGHGDHLVGLVQSQRRGRLTHLRSQAVQVEVGQVVTARLVGRVQQRGVEHAPVGLGAAGLLPRHAEGVQPQVGHRVALACHGEVLGTPEARRGEVAVAL